MLLIKILKSYWTWLFKKEAAFVKERKRICRGCPYSSKGFCTQCGCLLKAKIAFEGNSCPIELWKEED